MGHSSGAAPASAMTEGEGRDDCSAGELNDRFPKPLPKLTQDEPVTVTIDGTAVAKGRPRVTRRGFCYTPSRTRKYEAHGRLAAQMAMEGRPPIAGPVKLVALVELPVPTSWSRRKTSAAIVGDLRPTTRPDLDNFLKSALDAINGIVIGDDCQIVELEARKKYGVDPKFVLTIVPLAPASAEKPGELL